MTSRYSQRPFPSYRYVPGRQPHPTRDPAGHSYGVENAALDHFDADNWQNCEEYLYAIDLLNHGYWWEAHESLEAIWLAAGRGHSKTGRFIQGVLQIGIGQLKQYQGLGDAAQRMRRAGLDKIRVEERYYLGLDTHALRLHVEALLSGEITTLPQLELHFDKPNA